MRFTSRERCVIKRTDSHFGARAGSDHCDIIAASLHYAPALREKFGHQVRLLDPVLVVDGQSSGKYTGGKYLVYTRTGTRIYIK